jgi:hypothetical protein
VRATYPKAVWPVIVTFPVIAVAPRPGLQPAPVNWDLWGTLDASFDGVNR